MQLTSVREGANDTKDATVSVKILSIKTLVLKSICSQIYRLSNDSVQNPFMIFICNCCSGDVPPYHVSFCFLISGNILKNRNL